MFKNFNIAKDNIARVIPTGSLSNKNMNSVISYYNNAYDRAREATMSGEFTGNSFNNLEILENYINSNTTNVDINYVKRLSRY